MVKVIHSSFHSESKIWMLRRILNICRCSTPELDNHLLLKIKVLSKYQIREYISNH